MVKDRELPHNLDAERAVLGAVLIHNDVLDGLDGRLNQAEFYRKSHQQIFAVMNELRDAGTSIDFVTLTNRLIQKRELEDIGGQAYLVDLTNGLPHATNVDHYAEIVRETSQLRIAIKTAQDLLQSAYSGDHRASELVTDAAEKLFDMGGSALPGKPVFVRDLVTPGIEAVELACTQKGAPTGLTTGFQDLDSMTAGLHKGDLILIAARTSVGKTALAMNIARHVAMAATVLVFSLEMSRIQLFMRMFSSEARVDSHRMRTGYLVESDWPKLGAATTSLAEARMLIDDTPSIGVREVRARSRQVKAEHGLGLIVVDYLQLMRGRGRFDNRTQEIGSISRGLKAVAKELDVPLIALAQLSRASEAQYGRKARRPQLSDLRESGDLENDADVVLLIYRPEGKDDGAIRTESLIAELIIAKQRNGPTGTVEVAFAKEFVRFDNKSML